MPSPSFPSNPKCHLLNKRPLASRLSLCPFLTRVVCCSPMTTDDDGKTRLDTRLVCFLRLGPGPPLFPAFAQPVKYSYRLCTQRQSVCLRVWVRPPSSLPMNPNPKKYKSEKKTQEVDLATFFFLQRPQTPSSVAAHFSVVFHPTLNAAKDRPIHTYHPAKTHDRSSCQSPYSRASYKSYAVFLFQNVRRRGHSLRIILQ